MWLVLFSAVCIFQSIHAVRTFIKVRANFDEKAGGVNCLYSVRYILVNILNQHFTAFCIDLDTY